MLTLVKGLVISCLMRSDVQGVRIISEIANIKPGEVMIVAIMRMLVLFAQMVSTSPDAILPSLNIGKMFRTSKLKHWLTDSSACFFAVGVGFYCSKHE